MASVDNRVVRMEFDNAAFEKKLQTTLSSLGQLNKALEFKGATKGLNDIHAASGKLNFSNMAQGIEGISKKFLAMSTIAITALSQITSRALSAGLTIAKSLSLENVIAGFKEYELNIGSIQTILANTKADGTNLKQVNAALDELNTFADKTIYNFGQMTKNIGTFTAAGVDLKTSVQSIKGISNLAAISGSSADQAATAMYQLSQAISTGSLKLMDWNSVVNAGMGGEVFQKALFETGKALKTIPGVPIGKTFEEWTKGGNSFRSSLEKGWLTSEVLTTTLQGFTGEMTEAQLLAKGFTKDQAKNIIELGNTGVEAATKIRTATGLINTMKESIGSGWSETFRIIVGDFDQATELFSGIGKILSGIISRSSEARNVLLSGFAAFGGRKLLFDSLFLAVHNLGMALKPIKEAFRDIFPKTTVRDLLLLVAGFHKFAEALRPSQDTMERIGRIAKGFFSILSIGWTIIKEGVKFVLGLAHALGEFGGADFLEFAAKIGDFFSGMQAALVKGEGIHKFFEGLVGLLKAPIPWIEKIKDLLGSIFSVFDKDAATAVGNTVSRVGERMNLFGRAIDRIKEILGPFGRLLVQIGRILGKIWEVVSDFFTSLADKIGDIISSGDFDKALDALNTALLGGIVLLIRRFLKQGLKFGFVFDDKSGIFGKISQMFDQLTGVLKAMQAQIKAQALMKIATAIAILTASVLVLSLIDSKALTKALTAMSVGFGQLMAAFAILNKITVGPKSATSFVILSGGMIVLSGAMLLLAAATKSLAKLDWGELARGLTGVAALLAIITLAVIPLSKIQGSLIRTSVGLVLIGVALNLLAGAVKIFSMMSWGDMAKGLIGVAAALVIIGAAVQFMPSGMALTGIGLIAVSVGLIILSSAIKKFVDIPAGDLAKGLIAIGAGLLVIGGAMQAMPASLPITGAGLIIVSIGLEILAKAITKMSKMSWGEIAKGLTVLAASLIILAIAMNAMSGAIGGAVALLIATVAIGALATVLKLFSKMDWGDLIQGMLKIAAALGILALTSLLLTPFIPLIAALAIALGLLGIAFALFGTGAFLAAKAFEILAKSGAAGAAALVDALKSIGEAIPALATGFAKGMIDMFDLFVQYAPKFVDGITKILIQLLDATVKMAPKMGEAFGALVQAGLVAFIGFTPLLVAAGINFLLTFLSGINDNIDRITTAVVGIVTGFLTSLADPKNMNRIVGAGLTLLLSFMSGIANNIERLITSAVNIVAKLVFGIAQNAGRIVSAGATAIIKFVEGLGQNAQRVVTAGVNAVLKFIQGLGQNAVKLASGAADVVIQLLQGLAKVTREKDKELKSAGADLIAAILNGMTFGLSDKLLGIGRMIGDKLKDGLSAGKKALKIVGDPYSLLTQRWYGEPIINGITRAFDNDTTMEASASDLVTRTAEVFKNSLSTVTNSLGNMEEFNPTITPVLDLTQVASDAAKIGGLIQPSAITPSFSTAQARTIASTQNAVPNSSSEKSPGGNSEVSFHQTINAPEQLSTSDIYKQTRNQITMAKEELSIA